MDECNDEIKRLSVRRVAILYGLPTRVVARAVAYGDLPAFETMTETGRIRMYIAQKDAALWSESLSRSANDQKKSVL
jgi:hypothetical protein